MFGDEGHAAASTSLMASWGGGGAVWSLSHPPLTELLPSVAESVRETVGRTVQLSLRRRVQLEVKGDKVESRVLVGHACAPCFQASLTLNPALNPT